METQEEVSAPVPVTRASVTDTSPSDTTPAIATVCSTTAATVSKPCSTFTTTSVATTTTCSTAAATVSKPCSMFTTTSVATDSTYTVTTSTSTVPSTSVKAPLDVATKIARLKRPLVTAKYFCTYLNEKFPHTELPSFDNVTGKEWDSRAKAYIRQQIKPMMEPKELSLTNYDVSEWTQEDTIDIAENICEILSNRNYLNHYVYGIVKNNWNSAKNSLKRATNIELIESFWTILF